MLNPEKDRRPLLVTLLTDRGYDDRLASRNRMERREFLSDAEAIERLHDWLQKYYKTTLELTDISTLARYLPDREISSDVPTEFTGSHGEFRILELTDKNVTELIHEICHIIVAEPHELRAPNYGLTENQVNTPTEENEARTYVMQWYLLRQAGWPDFNLDTLPKYYLKYLQDDHWDGINPDFTGKAELIEILTKII